MSHKLVSLYIGDGEYYTRTDADAVIAELEERIADGDKDFEMAYHQNERLLQIVRHQKRKRCLAMASLCHWKMGVFIYKKEKSDFYYRWHKRWLKIAEKFKEAKG